MSRTVVGVVEIGANPTLLLVAAVFVVTFVAIATLAYFLLRVGRSGASAPTWQVRFQTRLPVTPSGFERIARVSRAAVTRPPSSPASRAQLDRLAGSREVFVSAYRILMILVGLAGLTGGALLLRSHTPGNMHGLPGGIILLVSLGALLNGLAPGPSIRPSVELLDPALLDQLKRKIKVQVRTADPLRVTLSESDLQRAAELLRREVPVADVARAVHPGYDDLSDFEQRAVESVIGQAARGG